MNNWTVVSQDQVVKHYSFDDQGYRQAASHASKYGYEVWQSFNGDPYYLMLRPRVK